MTEANALEKKVKALMKDLPDLSEQTLYLPNGTNPENKKIWDKIYEYNKSMEPKDLKEKISQVAFPSAYYMWKMPIEMHEYVNKVLEYATKILRFVQPELGVATGITYSISQAVYGIKTNSGKHTASGLKNLVYNMRNVPKNTLTKAGLEKIDGLLDTVDDLIGKYFHKFNPKHAIA